MKSADPPAPPRSRSVPLKRCRRQPTPRATAAKQNTMKCSLLLALAVRAQFGHGFTGPAGGFVLSNCVSTAARCNSNIPSIVRRGVATTTFKAAASGGDGDVSGCSGSQRAGDVIACSLPPSMMCQACVWCSSSVARFVWQKRRWCGFVPPVLT